LATFRTNALPPYFVCMLAISSLMDWSSFCARAPPGTRERRFGLSVRFTLRNKRTLEEGELNLQRTWLSGLARASSASAVDMNHVVMA
jgi:hypothetical protein